MNFEQKDFFASTEAHDLEHSQIMFVLQKLVQFMPAWVHDVIKEKGGHSKY